MIELSDVTKQYQVGENSLIILNGVSMKVARGEFVAIMGPSGSGKSTLMHLLGCLDKPTSGEYWFDGQPIASLSSAELAGIRNQKIGFVFQNFYLLPRMSALKNVELPLTYAGVPRAVRHARAVELLSQVGLESRVTHLPSALSGGQKQRVAIARALANRPSLLLADEPTGALDRATGQDIMALLRGLNEQGVTVVTVTHDATVAAYAKRVVQIVDGQIVSDERIETSP